MYSALDPYGQYTSTRARYPQFSSPDSQMYQFHSLRLTGDCVPSPNMALRQNNTTVVDAATSRTIRIGTCNIGLIGLDLAMNKARKRAMTEAEAMDFLFHAVQEKNYIPAGMEEQYKIALFKEYAKLLHGKDGNDEGLMIRIFGPGCISCNGLQDLVIEVLAAMNIAADIEQIHDIDEIGRAGILQTPALMINGRLKSSGLLPTRAMLEQWLRESQD
jgi:hypothetical protein